MTSRTAVIVLAAGAGTRMRSSIPKVLHSVGGRTLVGHVLAATAMLEPAVQVVVVGSGRELVRQHLAVIAPAATTVVQEQQNGTGHAVRIALDAMPDFAGTVVVTAGDTPLMTGEALVSLVDAHELQVAAATVLSAVVPDATGYGRILRAADGRLAAIVEHKDATAEQRLVREVNSGTYAFDATALRTALPRLTTANVQGEEYLTDVLAILRADGREVAAVTVMDADDTRGVNDREQLAAAGSLLRHRVLARWMASGVTIVDPATTWVDADVVLEPDVVLLPGTRLHGLTRIAAGAVVGPDTTLTDTVVGSGATVRSSTCDDAEIGAEAVVGPYTYLRAGSRLGTRSKAGSFVEMKASVLGEGSKVPHLSYVGDAEIGVGTNVGAATIFVNYDGVAKHRTTVGDHVRIGSDSMLVAPVTIGDGAYTAAGSVIVSDVPAGALAVARSPQRNVEGWVGRRRPGTASATAAGPGTTGTAADDGNLEDNLEDNRHTTSTAQHGQGPQ